MSQKTTPPKRSECKCYLVEPVNLAGELRLTLHHLVRCRNTGITSSVYKDTTNPLSRTHKIGRMCDRKHRAAVSNAGGIGPRIRKLSYCFICDAVLLYLPFLRHHAASSESHACPRCIRVRAASCCCKTRKVGSQVKSLRVFCTSTRTGIVAAFLRRIITSATSCCRSTAGTAAVSFSSVQQYHYRQPGMISHHLTYSCIIAVH